MPNRRESQPDALSGRQQRRSQFSISNTFVRILGCTNKNCIARNHKSKSRNSWQILELNEKWKECQQEASQLRGRRNKLAKLLAPSVPSKRKDNEDDQPEQSASDEALKEAKELRASVAQYEGKEKAYQREIENLALEIPNLSSSHSPVGNQPDVIGFINEHPEHPGTPSDRVWRSHAHIGAELDLLDFEGAARTSGWGWYYLKNEAALLEQALVQYALNTAMRKGWKVVSPPSMVYEHIALACGFQPRDQNGEQQIYAIEQPEKDKAKPKRVMAGTAEIALAGMKAGETLIDADMPLKVVGVSRSYRSEAGSHGTDTKGLYRVHEFTKVEMFAWTMPATPGSDAASDNFIAADASNPQADLVFAEMLELQKEILQSLGLHCRVLEMPTTDLGASAARKIDIEAFFPSRRGTKAHGWGEVSSLSLCHRLPEPPLGYAPEGRAVQAEARRLSVDAERNRVGCPASARGNIGKRLGQKQDGCSYSRVFETVHGRTRGDCGPVPEKKLLN